MQGSSAWGLYLKILGYSIQMSQGKMADVRNEKVSVLFLGKYDHGDTNHISLLKSGKTDEHGKSTLYENTDEFLFNSLILNP